MINVGGKLFFQFINYLDRGKTQHVVETSVRNFG